MNQSKPENLRPARLKYILIALFLLLAIYPLFESGGIRSRILNIFFTGVLLSSIYVVSSDNRRFVLALSIGLPWMIASWANTFVANPVIILASFSLGMLFLLFTALTILSYVLRAEKISTDVIYGALSVYLLLGITWAGAFNFLETIQPGSFYVNELHNVDAVLNMSDFIYYSFTTLTTLGYGDIAPVTSRARSLAILEAISGVLYMAVLIGRLVGTYIMHSTKS